VTRAPGVHAAHDLVTVRNASLLDDDEWGSYRPTFGLIGVDRETFVRTPKPSLVWLGDLARRNALPTAQAPDPVPVG
jgi:hypothetical protein